MTRICWVKVRTMERLEHLIRFYSILDKLERNIGGARKLADYSGRIDWPARGVYFFRKNGESRTDTGAGLRIVRVGTHALKAGGGTHALDPPVAAPRTLEHKRRQPQRVHF